ncbi:MULTISPECIES: hypothetical protein [Parachlamydia]|jgi:hypothetical protein|uniref:hypothetical protein n=1 Tax=Parachlamydia TaxID=83551 RepID=UPI0001C175ED|nr:hypothetical protein [Parachlamydia acanthamoebae]EFB42843.1 hypothetical protein pah_c001o029 [Parachlamydia acanthamoebae str. Hall's coccus]
MTLYFALMTGICAVFALVWLLRQKKENRIPEILNKEEKFSLLLDQSIERVFDRFMEEIPMAGMFLKGATAEKLKKTAKKELEPLWGEVQALEMVKETNQVKPKYPILLIGCLLISICILVIFLLFPTVLLN